MEISNNVGYGEIKAHAMFEVWQKCFGKNVCVMITHEICELTEIIQNAAKFGNEITIKIRYKNVRIENDGLLSRGSKQNTQCAERI